MPMISRGVCAGCGAAPQRGQERPSGEAMKAGLCLAALLCGLPTGCGLVQSQLDRQLLAQKAADHPADRLAEQYFVRFPDVLEVTVADRPELSGARPLRVDG